MEIKELDKRLEYTHNVEYNGEVYKRKEVMVPECFAWENEPDKLIDLHTVSWVKKGSEWNEEYYSCDHGWSGEDRHMHKSNPVPEIELEFKITLGKDLFYFQEVLERNS